MRGQSEHTPTFFLKFSVEVDPEFLAIEKQDRGNICSTCKLERFETSLDF